MYIVLLSCVPLFQPLELLWKSLEEWLIVLHSEIQKFETSPEIDKQTMMTVPQGSVQKSSSDGDEESSKSITKPNEPHLDNQSLAMVSPEHGTPGKPGSRHLLQDQPKLNMEIVQDDEPMPAKMQTEERGKSEEESIAERLSEQLRLSVETSAGSENLLSAVVPRISAVIQAFYICCSGQTLNQ